jgi:hypothetical protein
LELDQSVAMMRPKGLRTQLGGWRPSTLKRNFARPAGYPRVRPPSPPPPRALPQASTW